MIHYRSENLSFLKPLQDFVTLVGEVSLTITPFVFKEEFKEGPDGIKSIVTTENHYPLNLEKEKILFDTFRLNNDLTEITESIALAKYSPLEPLHSFRPNFLCAKILRPEEEALKTCWNCDHFYLLKTYLSGTSEPIGENIEIKQILMSCWATVSGAVFISMDKSKDICYGVYIGQFFVNPTERNDLESALKASSFNFNSNHFDDFFIMPGNRERELLTKLKNMFGAFRKDKIMEIIKNASIHCIKSEVLPYIYKLARSIATFLIKNDYLCYDRETNCFMEGKGLIHNESLRELFNNM
ncbi:MAG: hypothetical protein ACFFHV_21430, partial [Promethearchaeota archaeon]